MTCEVCQIKQNLIEKLKNEIGRALSAPPKWQPIETAPKDGTAILAYGRHVGSPPDAQRGVKAGDHWWAIIVWDIWREHKWRFAKDGAMTWSIPTHWMPLPAPPTQHEEN